MSTNPIKQHTTIRQAWPVQIVRMTLISVRKMREGNFPCLNTHTNVFEEEEEEMRWDCLTRGTPLPKQQQQKFAYKR